MEDGSKMIVVQKNGQTQFEITSERLGDPNVRVQDIQDFKQDIALLSGIPALRLGLMDGSELREKIVNANIQFAEQIIYYQRNLNIAINKLFDTILYKLTDKKIPIPLSSIINISLNEPHALKLFQVQNLISTVSTIIGTLSQTVPNFQNEFDVITMLKELLPEFDWDKYMKPENPKENELDEKIGNQQSQQNQQQSGGF